MGLYHIKLAFRNFLRFRTYTLINLFGLSLGITAAILILLWTSDELNTDRFHKNINQIYLVRTWQQYGNSVEAGSGTPPALGPVLKDEYPEVINSARIENGSRTFLFRYNDIKQYQEVVMADPDIFKIFSFPLVSGSIKEAYTDDNVLVLSETTARKLFGKDSAIGKMILVKGQGDFKVIAVMKDIPGNSTIKFDAMEPINNFRKLLGENYINTWYNLSFRTYVTLQDHTDISLFDRKIKGRIKEGNPDCKYEPFVYPFKDVYLKLWNNQKYTRIFLVTALLILVVACINFINLSTANASRRARFVGIQKIAGAVRPQIIRQFFTESMILTFAALLVAIILIEICLPWFNNLTNKNITLHYFGNTGMLAGILGITVFSGLVSGIYPALMLSSFNPLKVLRGKIRQDRSSPGIRRILVIAQFSISVFLIISTIAIYRQVVFLKHKDLGLNKDQIMYVMLDGSLKNNYKAYKNELLRNSGIESVSLASGNPTGIYWNWEGRDPGLNPVITFLSADEDFAKTFGIKMTHGEFVKPYEGTLRPEVVINETLARIMHNDNPVGSWLEDPSANQKLTIIGVVKDFNFKPLTHTIDPLIIFNGPELDEGFQYAFIKLNDNNIQGSIKYVGSVTRKFNPDYPFRYSFLDENYARMYNWFERINVITLLFSITGIFISCIGLFGLAMFIAENRTKEIGIRKVNGATTENLIILLSREFIMLVLAGMIIAMPVALVSLRKFMEMFVYKAPLSWWIFAAAGLLTLLIALLTVSYHCGKTALKNPVEVLRYE